MASRTRKLTKPEVDSLEYTGKGNGACYYWDSVTPGFGVRVFPSGKKSFVLAYRANNRKRFLTLGRYGAITLDQARRLAKVRAGEISDGGDPQTTKQQQAQGETIGALCSAYMDRHAIPNKKTWKEDQRRLERFILPRWGNLKAKAITRADVAALHSEIGKTARYEANRVLALLSNLFEKAQRWGFIPEEQPNPAHRVDKFKEQQRERWITPDELPRLAAAINEEPNESARAALWLYLLTGARKSELLGAKWADVDWSRKELRLAETKAGRVHYIPLSGPALALLEQLPRVEGNPYILPGKLAGRPLVNISKPWNRVKAAAGVEDAHLHDLRRTVGSWLAQSGNSLHLIGRVLNHSNTSTTAIYARFGQNHAAEALEKHGAALMGAAGVTKGGEVIPITQGKKPEPLDKAPPMQAGINRRYFWKGKELAGEIYEYGPLKFCFMNPESGRKKCVQLREIRFIDEPKNKRGNA